jgi:hypothetical protein
VLRGSAPAVVVNATTEEDEGVKVVVVAVDKGVDVAMNDDVDAIEEVAVAVEGGVVAAMDEDTNVEAIFDEIATVEEGVEVDTGAVVEGIDEVVEGNVVAPVDEVINVTATEEVTEDESEHSPTAPCLNRVATPPLTALLLATSEDTKPSDESRTYAHECGSGIGSPR